MNHHAEFFEGLVQDLVERLNLKYLAVGEFPDSPERDCLYFHVRKSQYFSVVHCLVLGELRIEKQIILQSQELESSHDNFVRSEGTILDLDCKTTQYRFLMVLGLN